MFHADRGTQFTSEKLWEVCRNLGIAQSVGRTGVCFDNAMAESFWSTLKTEFYDRQRWPTRDAALKAVAYWMEVVYNRRRRHSDPSFREQIQVVTMDGFTGYATAVEEQLPQADKVMDPFHVVHLAADKLTTCRQ